MKATKEQIVKGLVSYAENDLIPKIWDRALQFAAAAAVNTVKMFPVLADPFFDHPVVKTLLFDDGSGRYELDGVFSAISETFRQYREFPVALPSLPFAAKAENTLTFRADDLDDIKRRIEAECGYQPAEDRR